MKTLRTLFLVLALGLWVAPPATAAETRTPDQVKKRMKANLPAIDKLKKAGRIGENNKGYLEARAKLTEKEKALIKTENADRKFVYQLLAKRAGSTLEKVQAIRAKQIRERSAPGLWLQAPDGHWYRKPKS
jgi:uncharacterized protein YdbL (DUF1318 family)